MLINIFPAQHGWNVSQSIPSFFFIPVVGNIVFELSHVADWDLGRHIGFVLIKQID